jgi:hypothetical protein
LVEKGLVDEKIYLSQNNGFGNYFGRLMKAEIPGLNPKLGAIQIYGVGLCRDYMWIKSAVLAKFDILVRDVSQVACNRAQGILRTRGLVARDAFPKRTPGGAAYARFRNEKILSTEEIDPTKTVAIYASQFVEHQDDLSGFMQGFGRFIRHPGRNVYIVLPLREDNPADKVKFDSAIPPSMYDLEAPLIQGFGGRPNICFLGRHKYFDRTYTCVRFRGN